MKRKLLFFVVAILLPIVGRAEGLLSDGLEPSHKYEVRVTWSGVPTLTLMGYGVGCCGYWGAPNIDNLYGTYSGAYYTTGNIMAEFVAVLSSRASLSVGLSYSDCFGKIYSTVDNKVVERDHNIMLALLPQLRAYWVRRNVVSIYSSVALGMGINEGSWCLLPQFYPIGVEVGGGSFFGVAEMVNLGFHSLGGTIGVGYRF